MPINIRRATVADLITMQHTNQQICLKIYLQILFVPFTYLASHQFVATTIDPDSSDNLVLENGEIASGSELEKKVNEIAEENALFKPKQRPIIGIDKCQCEGGLPVYQQERKGDEICTVKL